MNKIELLCRLCIQDRNCILNDVYDRLQQLKNIDEERNNFEFLKNIKVRFLNPQGDFDYARLYEIIKINNEFYLLTNRDGYREFHNDSLSYDEKNGYKYLVKIIYAGIYTYLRDLNGNRIYLYDIVGGYNSEGRYLSGVVTIDINSGNSFLAVDAWSDWAGGLPMFIGYDESSFYIRPDTLKVLGQLTFSSGDLGKWPKGLDASEKAYLQGQNKIDKHFEKDNNTRRDVKCGKNSNRNRTHIYIYVILTAIAIFGFFILLFLMRLL